MVVFYGGWVQPAQLRDVALQRLATTAPATAAALLPPTALATA